MPVSRKELRQYLLAARQNLSTEEQTRIEASCLQHVQDYLNSVEPGIIGLYWPIKGEIDCLKLATSLVEAGWTLSVPVMNEAKQLDFAIWTPETAMENGRWNIPVPIEKQWVHPSRFLVPLVGFDRQNYRLGYGGGYYDRTLAKIYQDVETIGIGMELGRSESIEPSDWDIPMNRIITEAGMQ